MCNISMHIILTKPNEKKKRKKIFSFQNTCNIKKPFDQEGRLQAYNKIITMGNIQTFALTNTTFVK